MNASEKDIAEQLTLIDFRVFKAIEVCWNTLVEFSFDTVALTTLSLSLSLSRLLPT